MRILTHTVTEADSGFLSRLKFRGAITVNGAPVTVRFVPRPGDLLAADVSDLPGENPHIQPVDYPLDILYEDEDLLLINKPAGIAMHPAALTEEPVTVAGAVAHYLRTDCFHAVNRLDRGTTGVMAAAKTGYIHALCMAQLHTDAFQRDYRAVCEGETPESGCVNVPIGLKPGHKVERCAGIGDEAVTEFQTVKTSGGYSLVDFHLKTGRTHQIRVHMAHFGHPVAGDDLYGGHLDRTEHQMLCCRAVHLLCPALDIDKTVVTDFSAEQKACFPELFQ